MYKIRLVERNASTSDVSNVFALSLVYYFVQKTVGFYGKQTQFLQTASVTKAAESGDPVRESGR